MNPHYFTRRPCAEGKTSLADLTSATDDATNAIKVINDVKKAIVIAAALIGLAAAIPTNNVETIFAALTNLNDILGGTQTQSG